MPSPTSDRGSGSEPNSRKVGDVASTPERAGWVTSLLRAQRVPVLNRLIISLVLGCLAAAMTARRPRRVPGPRDFGQVWFAARSLLRDVDPYPLVGPGLTFQWDSPLVYPLTAALLAIPFTPFPEPVASMLFAALGGAVFAWVLMAYGYGPLFGFFSLLHAGGIRGRAVVAHHLRVFRARSALVHPHREAHDRGSALRGSSKLVGRRRWRDPSRPRRTSFSRRGSPTGWARLRDTARWAPPTAPYRAIVSFPGGALALLCLLRWRRPEARLIAALVCVPITPMLYETLPLFLIPRTFWEAATLVGLSYAQHHVTTALGRSRGHTRISWLSRVRCSSSWMYLPRHDHDSSPTKRRGTSELGRAAHCTVASMAARSPGERSTVLCLR